MKAIILDFTSGIPYNVDLGEITTENTAEDLVRSFCDDSNISYENIQWMATEKDIVEQYYEMPSEWEQMQRAARKAKGKPREGSNADWCGSLFWPIGHTSDCCGMFLVENYDQDMFYLVFRYCDEEIEDVTIKEAKTLSELQSLLNYLS